MGLQRFSLRKTGPPYLKDGPMVFFCRLCPNFLDLLKSEFLMGFNMGFGTKILASCIHTMFLKVISKICKYFGVLCINVLTFFEKIFENIIKDKIKILKRTFFEEMIGFHLNFW